MTDYSFAPKRTPKPHQPGTEPFVAAICALDALTEWQRSFGPQAGAVRSTIRLLYDEGGRPGHRYRTCWRIADAFYMRDRAD
jgi:hypothetical protein